MPDVSDVMVRGRSTSLKSVPKTRGHGQTDLLGVNHSSQGSLSVPSALQVELKKPREGKCIILATQLHVPKLGFSIRRGHLFGLHHGDVMETEQPGPQTTPGVRSCP